VKGVRIDDQLTCHEGRHPGKRRPLGGGSVGVRKNVISRRSS
jgi:hypothetical protein